MGTRTWIILSESDYETERWIDICDIVNVPHSTTQIKINFDIFKDVEIVSGKEE